MSTWLARLPMSKSSKERQSSKKFSGKKERSTKSLKDKRNCSERKGQVPDTTVILGNQPMSTKMEIL